MDTLLQDIRFGVRGLLRDRGFTAVALITLALGIGANSAIFSLVNGVLLRELPYPQPERLVAVSPTHAFMRAEYAIARERMRTLESLGGYQPGVGVSVSFGDEAVRLIGARISSNLLTTLGVAPLGRNFTELEEKVGNGAVVILSDRLWRVRFGADRGALGKTITIDGVSHQIVGVMPRGFAFPDRKTDLWLPATIDAADRGSYWGFGGMRAVGRLSPTGTAAEAQRELHQLGEPMRIANPFWTPRAPYRADNVVIPLHDSVVGNARSMLLALLGAVFLVWLIACANVGNLLLARGLARERELALRMALGAGRARVVRQLVTESLTLSLLGGVAGLALGWLVLRALVPQLPADLPRLTEVQIDARVLGFTLLASLVAGLAFGTFPAFRLVSGELTGSLKEGSRTSTSAKQHRLSSTVVVAEVAFAVVLVTGAGLLIRSLQNLSRVPTGFVAEQVVTARLSPPVAQYREAERRRAFYQRVLQQVQSMPGVQSAALTGQMPFDGEISLTASAVEFVSTDPNNLPMFEFRAVTPDFFRTAGITILAGRAFSAADAVGALPVAIVDQTTAERFWPGTSPLGKRLGRPWMRELRTVVGVVAAVRNNGLRGEITPAYYVPMSQEPGNAAVVVLRTSLATATAGAMIERAVREADTTVPVSDLKQWSELVSGAAARERASTQLIGAFALLAMLLGAVGLYGVLSYAVTQRRRELSLRSALGASRATLLNMILKEGISLAALGLAIGLPAAAFASRALQSLLFGIQPGDIMNLVAVSSLLLVTCVSAALIPALRAVRAQPANALRG